MVLRYYFVLNMFCIWCYTNIRLKNRYALASPTKLKKDNSKVKHSVSLRRAKVR